MLTRLRRLWRDDRGISLVFVGAGFMAFMAATTLAVDVGMFMTARTQAQNAADAGALGGAVALFRNSFSDRSASGPAVQSAISAAQANPVMYVAPTVAPDDVTFPATNQVRVAVFRTSARNSPVTTLIGPLFGVPTVDISATATAEVSPANAMTCVKPFMIPDRWNENSDETGNLTGTWSPSSEFNLYDNKKDPLAKPDVYVGADNPADYTGYTPERDRGMQLVLRAGTGGEANPSFYYSWKMPGDTGGDFYRENIANCNQSIIVWGTEIVQEPGNMVGPTIDGIEELIAKDPDARWSDGCDCVTGSNFATSPRVFPIPLYDPAYYAEGQAHGRTADFRIANFLGFFVDYVSGNQIYGRVTDVVGVVAPDAGPVPEALFPKAIRLVQ